MLKKKDIGEKATLWRVPLDIVDKDYVIGHFLNSFYSNKENNKLFVFKGGTCLRKCYFPDYRFSEDLDFTVMDAKFNIKPTFIQKITDECNRNSGIIFGKIREKSKITDDKILQVNEFIIPFWGANHLMKQMPVSQDKWPTIQLDFSWNEEIVTPIEFRAIYHQYDDMFLTNKIPAYSLKEILIEKIRSFEQRKWNSARDYYDVWYLMQHVEINDWDNIRTLLIEKCKIKNVTVNPNIFNDNNRKKLLKKSWENSIMMQLSICPDFETVWFYLRDNLFQKLNFT